MDHLPSALDWSRVQSFLAVAETGSLSAAARQLGQSQPTLGRQIRALETALGISLFARQPRGLVPTEARAALLPAARAMAEAARALALAAAGRAEDIAGTVRITASRFVSLHLLPGILAGIRRAEPLIQIELVPSDESQNLLFREADIALRMYRPEQLDMVTRHICDLELGFFGATGYLDRRGRPETIEQLLTHDLIGLDRDEDILRGMRAMGLAAERSWFALRCDDYTVGWELVRAGCGIGLAQVAVASACPGVERVCRAVPLPHLPIWLTAHQAMHQTPRVRRVWQGLAQGLERRLLRQGAVLDPPPAEV